MDNFGDIGVCWRLARQLAVERGFTVRLWVDDLKSAGRLIPALDPQGAAQVLDGVEIRHWIEPLEDVVPGQVVIGAFAANLPESYLMAMARCVPRPRWINLEYLSAEAWVERSHGLPSPQRNGLTKWFFFPGFTPRTGGLLREPDLAARQAAFDRAVAEVAASARVLIADLHTSAAPRNRDVEAEKARLRARDRYGSRA